MDVFVSYSHQDIEFLKSLKRHFVALKGKVTFWDDSQIYAGMRWKEEIEKALDKAKVAILLVSADFFNSEFIMGKEVPFLLAAEKNGTKIFTIILKPCLFELYPQISQFQALNSPSHTIIQMDEAEKELTWTKLILRINELLQ